MNHIVYVSQEGAYCSMIPSYEWHVLLELKGIYFKYGVTQLSNSALIE
jgi:hypothetical protein